MAAAKAWHGESGVWRRLKSPEKASQGKQRHQWHRASSRVQRILAGMA